MRHRPGRPAPTPPPAEDLYALRDAIFDKAFQHEMRGTDADETIIGTRGPDAICAEYGNDVVKAGGGQDWIELCWDDDVVWGGSGRDVFQAHTYASHDKIMDWQDGQDILEIAFHGATAADVNIERVSARQHIVTVDGHPDFSVEILGRGFGIEDIIYT